MARGRRRCAPRAGAGIPTGPALWRHVVPRLGGVRALAWEMVGYGDSIPQGIDRDISVGRQADYLLAWLRALGIERAILAGHDLGGGVVQIAALRMPGVCAGLFLTNAIGYDSWPIPSVRAMRAVGKLVEVTPASVFKFIFAGFLRQGHSDPDRAEESIELHWRPYEAHDGAKAFVRQIRSLRTEDTLDVSPRLGSLRIPARVAWGVRDEFQRVAYGERFARDLGTTLYRIEEGKHFTPEDHPDAVAAAITELVAETMARSGRVPRPL